MYLFLPHSQNKGQSYRRPPALFCSQECFERVSEYQPALVSSAKHTKLVFVVLVVVSDVRQGVSGDGRGIEYPFGPVLCQKAAIYYSYLFCT